MPDIRTLREAVEAGSRGNDFWGAVHVLPPQCITNATLARDGSLDAAKALHDALLPRWGFWVWSVDGDKFHADVTFSDDPEIGASGPTPARAWLIAILKALEARENGRDG